MAETQSGETIRSMISGFNAMQAQLGLLPVQSGQQPLGVMMPPPPPPPRLPHPSEMAIQVSQQQQAAMQQTIQAAQMTRYTPPPSSPPMGGGGMPMSGGGGGGGGMDFTWGRSFNQMAGQQLNPFVANAFSGGAGMGMPNPMMMTAPQFGGYRPRPEITNPYLNPGRIPDPMNPFAVQPPSSGFAQRYQQDYRMMQGQQSAFSGFGAAKVMGGMSLIGSIAGGVLGSAFGPLGSMAGAWLGGKVAGGIGGMAMGSAIADEQRGRQLQNTTAPWMVGGQNFNPFTGQGLERQAATEAARGLRRMTRDHDFERQTGFNTADIMKITQLSSDQGLLQTARSPDDITRKVKDISKAVKVLVQITGDPDVRNAIASLGQMRELGFTGLAAQSGAISNRAAFARMAGVSQAAMMQQYGAPGAMMAQQIGMAGATGLNAGMMGGAAANMAVSAGAFNDLQLSRAGGRGGLAQTNMMAALGAANQDLYMAAALRRGAGGKLDIDAEAYKRAQGMSVGDVARMAQENISRVGQQGIYELSTRKQEFKDMLAQKMGPMGMQMNVVRQAQGLMREVPGMTFGAALRVKVGATEAGQGMSAEQQEAAARSLELQFTNREFWDTQMQQMQLQKRQIADRERARRAQYRTPGTITRIGRGIRGAVGGVSDFLTDTARESVLEPLNRVQEENAAFGRGERVDRYSAHQIIRNPAEMEMARAASRNVEIQRLMSRQGADPFAESGGSRLLNQLGSGLGISSLSDANKASEIAMGTIGKWTHGQDKYLKMRYINVNEARKRITDVSAVSHAMTRASTMTTQQSVDMMKEIQKEGGVRSGQGFDVLAVLSTAYGNLKTGTEELRAGLGKEADAMGRGDIKAAFVKAVRSQAPSMSEEDASALYESKKPLIETQIMNRVRGSGDKKLIETVTRAQETEARSGAVGGYRKREELANAAKVMFEQSGLANATEAELGTAKGLLSEIEDVDVLAMAAARADANKTGESGQRREAAYRKQRLSVLTKRYKGDTAKAQEALMSEVQQADATLANTTDERRAILEKFGAVGGWNTGQVLRTAKLGFGTDMLRASQETFLKKTADTMGKSVADLDKGDIVETLKGIDIESAEGQKLDAKTRDFIKKLHSGKLVGKEYEAMADLVLPEGPKGTTELGGTAGTGAEGEAIDKQISEMAALRDSTTSLATAATKLDAVADKIGLIVTGPSYQSKSGIFNWL